MFNESERLTATILIEKGISNKEIFKQLKSETATNGDIAVLKYKLKNQSAKIDSPLPINKVKRIIVNLSKSDRQEIQNFINGL